jgi:uncharacterized membrane protein YvbJ
MVYCSKCGTKNEEVAETCVKCGAKLIVPREKDWEKRLEEGAEEFGKRAEAWGESFGKRAEDECFGLPHGGTIFGLVFGIIIIIVGILWITGITLEIWPILILIVGILIISGAIYTLTRKQKR